MKTRQRIIGFYQIIGGGISLLALGRIHSERGMAATVILLLLSALAIAAGAGLWRGWSGGWRLTMLNQVVQLVGFYTPVLAFNVIHGAGFTVGTRYFAAEQSADSNFRTGSEIMLGGSTCDVLWGRMLMGMPDYGLSLNLLALGVLIFTVVILRKSTGGA